MGEREERLRSTGAIASGQGQEGFIELNGDEYELRAPHHLQAIALRALIGATPLDRAIDAQDLPERRTRQVIVRSLRWYRRRISPCLGDRCVMDPSCSRYAEQAVRHRGVLRGGWWTVGRLRDCRPGQGRLDLPDPWLPANTGREHGG